jgi:uncharacterized protein YgiM (DUF1202 family)
MKKLYTLVVILLTLTALMSSCASAPKPTASPTAAEVIPATVTSQPTKAPTALPSATAAPASTSTPEASPTVAAQPLIKATGNLNCRSYPSNSTNVIGYLKKNQQTEVLGRDASGEWYLIANLTYPDRDNCWIFNSGVELSVDPSEIPPVSATRP